MSYTVVENNLPSRIVESKNVRSERAAAPMSAQKLLARDTLLASNQSVEGNTEGNISLNLPSPLQSLKDAEKVLGTDQFSSIVAVLGEVLALQAKTNSDFWDTLFKTGTINMNTAVELAPLIAQAITSSFSEQANATDNDASIAKWQGIMGASSGAMTIIGGAISAGGDGKGVGNQENEIITGDKTSATTVSSAERDVTAQTQELNEDQGLDQNGGPVKGTVGKALTGAKGVAKTAGQWIYKTYEKSVQASQLASIGSQIGVGFTTWHYSTNKAEHQRAQGKFDALSKQYEQYAQYYNQNFSRLEELRQGSQQNIDLAMQLLKSLSDIVTSTAQSMFRG